MARHAGSDCPLKRCILVTRTNGYENKPLPAVLFFAREANGNVSPAGEISGSKTMLFLPSGLAMDSRGNVYVTNDNDTITVYAAGALGNVAPIRTISGNEAKLNNPGGLAVDSHDELYVANCPNAGKSWINVFESGANGNAAPIRTIEGQHTHLYCPWGLAFDSQSNLNVANDDPNNGWITVYAANANGNASPERTIKGPHTELTGPAGLAVDASGYIYVVDSELESICIFSPNAHGDEAPVSYFPGPIYGFGLGLDGHANIYVTSVGYDDPPSITVYAAGASGNHARILRMIEGGKTRLLMPRGIVVR
ncbi:MAG TPA: NHL repeat-containing protein [Candidatus Cybelea sp.]